MPRTAWHITISTYGARLHGDARPTVDRAHNIFGTPFLDPDPERHRYEHAGMSAGSVEFSPAQRAFIEATIPMICERGKWTFVTCAAAPDHVHTLLRADSIIHGKQVRKWLKTWLTQALDRHWHATKRADGMSWFCEGGSTKAVRDQKYFWTVVLYISGQRATPAPEIEIPPQFRFLLRDDAVWEMPGIDEGEEG